ncbi:MAG TPA: serine/threonine-protein kinase [Kofleriaceae bacterium]|nr:serine/threonine-protein kinase [Kofleriaceae bacterium]
MIEPVSGEGPTVLSAGTDAGEERLASGARAGDYEVERFLGAGAMGDVYAGAHKLIGKRVAIKVIKRKLASSAEAVERFLREARAANQVDHPNVVDVFALGRLGDGRLYLVMDLLDGEPLTARVRKRMSPADALAVLAPIAAALDAAHARGVVHRDLKPDNVFVSGPADAPLVHVLDFGIAKLLSNATGERLETLTGEGTWLGTPAYMAPEQWSADGAGPASDRYALGVIAYQLFAGDVPFRAGSLPAMMEKHFRAKVPSLSTGAGALPPAVDEVLAKAMAKDPDARFASANEMLAALRAALGTARGGIARGAAASTGQGDLARRARAPKTAALAGGALAICALGAGAWMITHDRPRSADAGSSSSGGGGAQIEITTTPAGARVIRGGKDLGATPTTIGLEDGGGPRSIELVKPGYAGVVRKLEAGHRIDATLAPVRGFEGVWAMQDGTLRAFERRGEQVASYALDRADGPRRFLRMFEFAPGPAGETVYTAEEEHIDERAPDEPSCRFAVRAEYHYRPSGDLLELRKERASYDFDGGHCVVHELAWGDLAPMRRIGDRAPDFTEATGSSEIEPIDLEKAPAPVGQPPPQPPELKGKVTPKQKLKVQPKLPPPQAPAPQQQNAPDNAPNANAPPAQQKDDGAQAHQAQQLAPVPGN